MPWTHKQSDRLVSIRKDGTIVGKRVGKACPLSRKLDGTLILNSWEEYH